MQAQQMSRKLCPQRYPAPMRHTDTNMDVFCRLGSVDIDLAQCFRHKFLLYNPNRSRETTLAATAATLAPTA